MVYIVVLFFMSSCGYKQSAKAVRYTTMQKVHIDVKMESKEPENLAWLKDELYDMVTQRMHAEVVSAHKADTNITINYHNIRYIPLSFNAGYSTRYRVSLPLRVDIANKKRRYTRLIKTYSEAEIQKSAISSTSIRIDAIREAMKKAVDQLVAYLGTIHSGV